MAREIFSRHKEVKKVLWWGNLWTSGFYANTVGMYGNQDVIRQYIQNQGQDEKEYIQLHKGQLTFEFWRYPDPWVGELHWTHPQWSFQDNTSVSSLRTTVEVRNEATLIIKIIISITLWAMKKAFNCCCVASFFSSDLFILYQHQLYYLNYYLKLII